MRRQTKRSGEERRASRMARKKSPARVAAGKKAWAKKSKAEKKKTLARLKPFKFKKGRVR